MMNNAKLGRPVLENCGDYVAINQLDVEVSNVILLPQDDLLDAITKHYPNATLILNTRADWANAVQGKSGLGARFSRIFPDVGGASKTEKLDNIYKNHLERVRKHVQQHPSHILVEIKMEDSNAGQVLADKIGGKAECWDTS
jgi:hypothetical protein